MSTQIVRPAWKVDGWAGNYVDDNGVVWFVSQDAGWFEAVEDRVFSTDKPADDGIYSSPNLDAARVINLTGCCKAPDKASLDSARNQFNALLKGGHLFPLLVEEPVVDKTAMVKRAGGRAIPKTSREFDWQLIMTAPDARKYAATAKTASTPLAQDAPGGIQWDGPAGGTGVRWNGPAGTTGLSYQTGNGQNGVIQISNDGTADTPVTLTIAGPVDVPSVIRTDTGETITWNGTVAAGATLVIDTGTGSVLLNGSNQRPLLTRADFFVIPPGVVDVLFQSPTPSPTALLTATWADAWH
jgi:hypothetical protein